MQRQGLEGQGPQTPGPNCGELSTSLEEHEMGARVVEFTGMYGRMSLRILRAGQRLNITQGSLLVQWMVQKQLCGVTLSVRCSY